jgi:hypothetical protein
MKPRTTPHGGKPHTAPEHNHAVLSQAEQSKLLGVADEVVTNLGHASTQDKLVEHPLSKTQNYDSADTERTLRDPPKLQGVYTKCSNPRSGISSEQNIDAWGRRAAVNSYHGGHGEGVEPKMPDPRERAAAGHQPGGGKGSDGYLANPKEWASFEYGSESGQGRLEKAHKK